MPWAAQEDSHFGNFTPKNVEKLRWVTTLSLYCRTREVNDFIDNARTFIRFMNFSSLFSKKEKKITRWKGSSQRKGSGKDIADNRCSDRMTDRPCVFVSRPLLGSVCSCPSFSPHTYTYYTKNAIDTHRSLNRRGFYLFRFFRSLIIYSSTERRRDNEVISMSLTFNSKPSLLLLILVLFFSFSSSCLLMNTWIEMSNLRGRERILKIGEHPRLVIQEIEKEITRCSQCLIVIIWGGALVPL
jgi:hypothetical protein